MLYENRIRSSDKRFDIRPALFFVVGLALVNLLCAASVMAQAGQSSSQIQAEAGQMLPLTPVALPDLPEYTGKAKLERSVGFSATGEIEKSVSLTYSTQDSPEAIIAWYRSALGMYQWTIEHDEDHVIAAVQNRTGNSCNIYLEDESASGCNLHISYSFRKPPSN